jgi:hypothetical protein
MAKKSKSRKSRKRRSAGQRQQRRVAVATGGGTSSSSRAAAAAPKGATARQGQGEVDFAAEYSYVYADLKRVAIIAAAMVVILVALAFILA